MKKIAYVAIIVVIVVICGYAIKVASERDKMIAEEWEQHEIRAISKDSCMPKRDLVLKKYFGKSYKVTDSQFYNNKGYNNQNGSFSDKGTVEGVVEGKNGKFAYDMEVSIPYRNPKDWNLVSLIVKDLKSCHYVYIVRDGKREDPKEYEKANAISSSKETDVYVSDEDLYSIEDALQKEWNVSNALSSVGAESSNVFKVKKESVSGREVTVSYSLRSTYGGQKKFVDLHGVVKKNSDGSWSVVNLGY